MEEEVIKYDKKLSDKMLGFSASFNVKRQDTDFILAIRRWCKDKDISFSIVVVNCLKVMFLDSGNLFDDFKEIYDKVTDENLDKTTVIYNNKKMKLKDLLEEEFIVDGILKI